MSSNPWQVGLDYARANGLLDGWDDGDSSDDIPQPPPSESTFTGTPRPATWEGFVGNSRVVQILRDALNAAKTSGRRMDHTLIYGPPGTGKTTCAKIIAREIGGDVIETEASTLETQANVLRLLIRINRMGAAGRPAVLFLDEIHMLGKGKNVDQESLYSLLEDFVFRHNLSGTEMIDNQGNEIVVPESPLRVYPFLCIGATTEAGMLSEPLRRRFLVLAEMEPYTEPDIAQILIGAARMLGYEMAPEAATLLSTVSRRTPGQAMQMLTQTKNYALRNGPTTALSPEDAAAVIERMKFYPLGLTETDIRALKILANRGRTGMGQVELSRALGISLSQWVGMVEPFLRMLNFVETLNRRVITVQGLEYMVQIGQLDQTLPAVRAILARQGVAA